MKPPSHAVIGMDAGQPKLLLTSVPSMTTAEQFEQALLDDPTVYAVWRLEKVK